MKNIQLLLAAILISTGLSAQSQNVITATEAHVTISGQTTREQLGQVRADLIAQGFKFNYSPEFDGERRLIGLTYTISANDGQLNGAGYHKSLQNPNSSLTIHINKTQGTFSEDVVGDLSRN